MTRKPSRDVMVSAKWLQALVREYGHCFAIDEVGEDFKKSVRDKIARERRKAGRNERMASPRPQLEGDSRAHERTIADLRKELELARNLIDAVRLALHGDVGANRRLRRHSPPTTQR